MIPDRLTLLPLPALQGGRVLLRGRRESDIDERLLGQEITRLVLSWAFGLLGEERLMKDWLALAWGGAPDTGCLDEC